MAECIHGLDDRWCSTCLHGPERDTPWRPAVNHRGDHVVIAAKYSGTCVACGSLLDAGDTITLQKRNEGRTDEAQRWACAGCA